MKGATSQGMQVPLEARKARKQSPQSHLKEGSSANALILAQRDPFQPLTTRPYENKALFQAAKFGVDGLQQQEETQTLTQSLGTWEAAVSGQDDRFEGHTVLGFEPWLPHRLAV